VSFQTPKECGQCALSSVSYAAQRLMSNSGSIGQGAKTAGIWTENIVSGAAFRS
jgi:hypothetical protein